MRKVVFSAVSAIALMAAGAAFAQSERAPMPGTGIIPPPTVPPVGGTSGSTVGTGTDNPLGASQGSVPGQSTVPGQTGLRTPNPDGTPAGSTTENNPADPTANSGGTTTGGTTTGGGTMGGGTTGGGTTGSGTTGGGTTGGGATGGGATGGGPAGGSGGSPTR
ncbi:MAG TPA: hypothetical protein VEY95_14645 [Azospirillaceae bacterium]|nr:hypothetical protein [Azospirillaceae bacterium]